MPNPVSTRLTTTLTALAIWVVVPCSADAGSFRGDMLVTDQYQSKVLAFDPITGAYDGVFADLNNNGGAQTLAEGPNGTIYVSSPLSGQVFAYDGETGTRINSFQLNPPADYPAGLTFDPLGNLYVINALSQQINQYDPITGSFIRTVISGLDLAVGVAFTSGHLYVSSNSGLQQFDLNGNLTQTISGDKFFQVKLGPDGNLYAADGLNSVYEFTPSGSQVGSGPFLTGVSGAYGVGFDPAGNVYLANNFDSVFKFDSGGNPIGSSPFFTSPLFPNALLDVLYNATPTAVPEPGSLALLAIGVIGFAFVRTCRSFG